MKILILTTGGTIDKIYFDSQSQYQVGEPQIAEVLKEANVTIEYRIKSLMRKDSLDMTDADRRIVYDAVKASRHGRIVVTHGTDTMLLTAAVLKNISGKVIVLTGAMQPAKFRFTDAVFNIGAAVTAVQILSEGVHIVMNGRIFDPDHTVKNRRFNRFEVGEDHAGDYPG